MLLSESQERMLLVAEKGREEEVFRVFRKWGLDAVTDRGVSYYWMASCVSGIWAKSLPKFPIRRWPMKHRSTIVRIM